MKHILCSWLHCAIWEINTLSFIIDLGRMRHERPCRKCTQSMILREMFTASLHCSHPSTIAATSLRSYVCVTYVRIRVCTGTLYSQCFRWYSIYTSKYHHARTPAVHGLNLYLNRSYIFCSSCHEEAKAGKGIKLSRSIKYFVLLRVS